MRVLLAQLLGLDPANYPPGKLTYDLRRLHLHGIVERIPHSHRYQLTSVGLRIALFFSRIYARLLRPKLAQIRPRLRQLQRRCASPSTDSNPKSMLAANGSGFLPKLDAFDL
jgi:hypothetical protein